jgi:hypothetical protein
MNQREWIEFGKMYDNMTAVGFFVDLKMLKANSMYYCHVTKVNEVDDEVITLDLVGAFGSPYYALKHAYFTLYLEDTNTEDIELDISSESLAILYDLADKKYITIDELFTEILTDHLKTI